MGIDLVEVEDWNCCGNSSAHSIDTELAEQLPTRNLSLATVGQPLLVSCLSCFLHLKCSQLKLRKETAKRHRYEKRFGRNIDPDFNIMHFFEALNQPIPVIHFSELPSLALGEISKNGWFQRYLIDPRPMMRKKSICYEP